jgi:CspA family cold shock protein
MNFRDQELTCDVCGETYIFTVTRQRELEKAGQEVVPPSECPSCRMRDPETGRLAGQVKWFSPAKGYGFITRLDGVEIFFHRSQIEDGESQELDEGTPVTFEEITTEKGSEAQKVRVEN